MMVAVGTAALFLAMVIGLRKRSEDFRRTAAFHAQWTRVTFDAAWGFSSGTGTGPDGTPLEADPNPKMSVAKNAPVPEREKVAHKQMATRSWTQHLHHKSLIEKYEYAAGHPWLPVATDPPPPKFAPFNFD